MIINERHSQRDSDNRAKNPCPASVTNRPIATEVLGINRLSIYRLITIDEWLHCYLLLQLENDV